MSQSADAKEVELKFDGSPVRALGGAPADLVANSLWALQRMAHLLAMTREGQRFGSRANPNSKVRHNYVVVCHAPKPGSHIQPWVISSAGAAQGGSAAVVQEQLLSALRAFDSGNDKALAEAVPNARQRWLLADAAIALLPADDDIHLSMSLRGGCDVFFKADRARAAIERTKAGKLPEIDVDEIVGKIKAIDFSTTTLTLKPARGPQVKVPYPLPIEDFIKRNIRKRLSVRGLPDINSSGEIVSFSKIETITEVEFSVDKIVKFEVGGEPVKAKNPYGYFVGYDFQSRLFFVRDSDLGVDVFTESFEDVEREVQIDLDVLWRTYAVASDSSLTPDALALKSALQAKFRKVG